MIDLAEHVNVYLDEGRFQGRGGLYMGNFYPGDGVIQVGPLSFDVRGVVQLGASPEGREARILRYPQEVRGIQVDREAAALHFLHTGLGIRGNKSTEWQNREVIATYVVTYIDGASSSIPIRADWDHFNNISLRGGTPGSYQGRDGLLYWSTSRGDRGGDDFLFVRSWVNPRPEVPIKSIDMVSEGKDTELLLFGLTVDPVGEPSLNPEQMVDAVLRSTTDLGGEVAQEIFAELGRVGVQEEDLTKMVRAGWALALGEDRQPFLALSRQMRDLLANSDQAVDLRHLARTLLLPAARDDAELVTAGIEAARKASEMTPDHRLAPVERILIAYRLGNYAEAWSMLESTPPHKNKDRAHMLLLLRAKTAYQLGDVDEAEAALSAVRPMIEGTMNEIGAGRFTAWLHVNFVHRAFLNEARELIERGEAGG